MKLSGMMFAGMIIVICFVYAINVQPVAFGKSCLSIPSQRLNQVDYYKNTNDFLYKSFIRFSTYLRESSSRSRDILNIEDESKIPSKISHFYKLPDCYIKIFELIDFI